MNWKTLGLPAQHLGNYGKKFKMNYKHLKEYYAGKKIFLTGHTGFKGSWLTYWLTQMGAIVCGFSTSAPSDPAHIDNLNLDIESTIGDIRNQELLNQTFNEFKP